MDVAYGRDQDLRHSASVRPPAISSSSSTRGASPARAPVPAACGRATTGCPPDGWRWAPARSAPASRRTPARLRLATCRRRIMRRPRDSRTRRDVRTAVEFGMTDRGPPGSVPPAAIGDVAAFQHDAAAIGPQHAGDEVEQRRLAGAVRADDAERFAARQRQSISLATTIVPNALETDFSSNITGPGCGDQARDCICPPTGICGAWPFSTMTMLYLLPSSRH